MSEYRYRIKIVADLEKIRENGMKPYEVQKAIYDFFMDKGFTYQRHLGFIYERELTAEELDQIDAELDHNGWLCIFRSFTTDLIGETKDLTYLFRKK